ncbi:MAG: hypothetical protein ACLR6B_10050 [Blautia sp.]
MVCLMFLWSLRFMTFTGALKSDFHDSGPGAEASHSLLACLGVLHVLLPGSRPAVWASALSRNDRLITGMVLEFSVLTAVVSLMWVTIYSGNSPLSLSLVIADTLLSPFLIPATLQILVGSRVSMDAAGMMRELFYDRHSVHWQPMSLNELTWKSAERMAPSKLRLFQNVPDFCGSLNSPK